MPDENREKEISSYLLEFDEWRSGPEDTLETFAEQRGISSSCFEELRQTLEAGQLVSKLFHESDSVSTESNDQPNDEKQVEDNKYRFIKEIATGGMGTVWLGAQEFPIQRDVAIKVIRPELNTGSFLKRFEAERKAMSLMSHPNVAKVLDAGYKDGLPFIVMEYVPGESIIDYCNERRLSLDERLRLFIELCRAIQHAHQKSLLHRDIKPSNVLVSELDGKPVVKVIDFGLAKILYEGGEKQPELTQVKTVLGSPLWMSPEQAMAGEDEKVSVDTRTDVYSLGVILYQLITNTTPIQKASYLNASRSELIQAIQESRHPYPSVRISQDNAAKTWVKDKTGENFSSWCNQLRHDLDWVTMKAIAREVDRRYSSVGGLIDDVQRFIDREPVVARPPSLAYQLRKAIQKYRTSFLVATVSIVALIAVSIFALYSWIAAYNANQRAVIAQESADAFSRRSQLFGQLMLKSFENFNLSSPGVSYDATILDNLNANKAIIDEMEFEDASDEAILRFAIGRGFSSSGRHDLALKELRTAAEAYEEQFGSSDPKAIEARLETIYELIQLDRPREAYDVAKECLSKVSLSNAKIPIELDLANQVALNISNRQAGANGDFVKIFQSIAIRAEQNLGTNHPVFIDAKSQEAHSFYRQLRFKEASKSYETARDSAREYWGGGHRITLELDHAYWLSLVRDTQLDRSPEELKAYVKKVSDKFGPAHESTLQMRSVVAETLYRVNDFEGGRQMFLTTIELCDGRFGPKHPVTSRVRSRYAYILRVIPRKCDLAIEIQKDLAEIYRASLGADSPEFLKTQSEMARCYVDLGDHQTANSIASKSAEVALRRLGPRHHTTYLLYDSLAMSKGMNNDMDGAIEIIEQSIQRSLGDNKEQTVITGMGLMRLGEAFMMIGDSDSAILNLKKALEVRTRLQGEDHVDTHGCLEMLAMVHEQLRQYEEAESYVRIWRENIPRNGLNDQLRFKKANDFLIRLLKKLGKDEEAEKESQAVLDEREEIQSDSELQQLP